MGSLLPLGLALLLLLPLSQILLPNSHLCHHGNVMSADQCTIHTSDSEQFKHTICFYKALTVHGVGLHGGPGGWVMGSIPLDLGQIRGTRDAVVY